MDTTLVGFERMSWKRGHQTLIFQATGEGVVTGVGVVTGEWVWPLLCAADGHRVCDIHHDDKTVWEKEFQITA